VNSQASTFTQADCSSSDPSVRHPNSTIICNLCWWRMALHPPYCPFVLVHPLICYWTFNNRVEMATMTKNLPQMQMCVICFECSGSFEHEQKPRAETFEPLKSRGSWLEFNNTSPQHQNKSDDTRMCWLSRDIINRKAEPLKQLRAAQKVRELHFISFQFINATWNPLVQLCSNTTNKELHSLPLIHPFTRTRPRRH